MKKTLLFLLFAATTSTAAFAQARAGGEMSSKDYTGGGTTDSRNTGFGIKGGYNLNGLRGDDIKDINRDSRNDAHAGVYGQFGFNEFASVQAELLYSRQGFEGNTSVANPTATQKFRMDYISLPVMFVGNFTETLSFHVGPQVSLLTNVRQGGESFDAADKGFNSLDFGGVGGLEARLGPARIGARYNLSLGKLFEDGSAPSSDIKPAFSNSKMYNNLFQIYLGIGFTQ